MKVALYMSTLAYTLNGTERLDAHNFCQSKQTLNQQKLPTVFSPLGSN